MYTWIQDAQQWIYAEAAESKRKRRKVNDSESDECGKKWNRRRKKRGTFTLPLLYIYMKFKRGNSCTVLINIYHVDCYESTWKSVRPSFSQNFAKRTLNMIKPAHAIIITMIIKCIWQLRIYKICEQWFFFVHHLLFPLICCMCVCPICCYIRCFGTSYMHTQHNILPSLNSKPQSSHIHSKFILCRLIAF